MEFDTIAAISTPPGEGAIAIIRLSGDEAIQIADRIFLCAKIAWRSGESHDTLWPYCGSGHEGNGRGGHGNGDACAADVYSGRCGRD